MWLIVCAMILSCFATYSAPVRAESETVIATDTDAADTGEDSTTETTTEEDTSKTDDQEEDDETVDPNIIRTFPDLEGDINDLDYDGTGAEAFGNEYEDLEGLYFEEELFLAAPPESILPGYSDYTDYLNSHEISVDGKVLKSGDTIDPAKGFALKMDFTLNLTDMAANGLKYYFPLPDHISIGDKGSEEEPITLYNANRVAIGTYFIKDDVLYVEFPGYYDNVIAFFDMQGSWSGTESRTSIDVAWPKGTDNYKIDLCGLNVQKSQQSYVTQADGSLKSSFKITTRPKIPNASISDITFKDEFSNSSRNKIVEDTYGADKAIKVSMYRADKSLIESKYYKLSDVRKSTSTGTTFVIPGLDIVDGGYFVVEYETLISMDDRIAIDGSKGRDSYTNVGTSSYDYFDTTTGKDVTLSASARVTSEYTGGTDWIMKSASDETKTKYVDRKTKVVVPYVITINKRRPYSLGGSAVKDEITGFVGGDVVYDTSPSAETYVEWVTKKGEGTVEQKWVIVSPELLEELNSLCAKSPDTALANLRANTSLQSRVVDAINAAYGTSYTELDDEAALQYVFTDENSHNFVWFMPFDTTPTSYTIHYDTIVDPEVGSFSNAAALWYTEYEGVPKGPGGGWTRPVKKVMNATKSNAGVYIGADGKYYIDYTLTVGVEAGSAGFEDIGIRDMFPYHPVTLDDGNVYNVYDWVAGIDADSVDITTLTSKDNINLVSPVVDITTDSTDPAVRAVLDTAYAGFFYEVSGDTSPSSFYTNEYYPWRGSNFYQTTTWNNRQSGGEYYGKATPAGQFVYHNDLYNSTSSTATPLARRGGTFSPAAMLIWLGNLPGTEEGYDFTIKYTMQINPVLIEKLPEVLAKEGKEYITNTNTAEVWTSYKRPEYGNIIMNFRTNTRLQRMESPYWLGIQDDHPGIDKTVVGPSADNKYVTYEVTADPGRNIDAVDSKYELTDMLNIAGLKYKPDSFVMKDADGEVVWTNSPSATVASKYREYADLIDFKLDANDNTSNGYVFSFDNTSGKFTDENGKFMVLKIEYDVEMGDLPTDTTIQNTAGLFELTINPTDGTTKKKSLGEAQVEYAIDKALDKHITTEPAAQNNYKSSYYIDINPTSENAIKLIETIDQEGNIKTEKRPYEVGDVLEIRDVMSENQILKTDSIHIYKYKGVNFENETDITSLCDYSFNSASRTLRVDITIDDLAYRYRVVYDTNIIGESNAIAHYTNTASMDNSTAKVDEISKRVLIYEYTGGSDAFVYRVDLHKFDQYNLTKNLEAKFNLYKLEGKDWVLLTTGEENYEQIQTDSTGYASIANKVVSSQPILMVQNETYYKLVEVESPTGYVLDETPIYYYVSESGERPEVRKIPAQVPADELRVIRLKNTVDPDSVVPVIEITNQNFGLDIKKYDDASLDAVKGASFALYTDEECTQKIAEAADGNSVSPDGNAVYDSKLDGIITFRDIAISPDTEHLYLKETVVPTGYKKVDDKITLTIQNGKVTDAEGSSSGGLFVDDSGRLSVLLAPNEYKSGRLHISKDVTKADQDYLNRTFTFSAKIYTPEGEILTDKLPYKKSDKDGNVESGKYTSGSVFYLKDDEDILISGIPEGCTYEVKEVKDSDYKTTVSVADTAATDDKEDYRGYEATGSIEDGAIDDVAFINEARVNLTITKKAETESGEALSLPDGLTFQVQGDDQKVIAEVVYDEENQKFNLVDYKEVDIQITQVEDGFKLSKLPYSSKYSLVELNAEMNGEPAELSTDVGITPNGNWFSFYADKNIRSGNTGIDNDISLNLINTYTDNYVEYTPTATKTFNMPITAGAFTFDLFGTTGTNAKDPVYICSADVDADGNVKFPVQKLSKTGYYYFNIKEHIPDGAERNVYKGVTYDTRSYVDRVYVVRNADTNQLEISSIEHYRSSYSTADEVTFNNKYSASSELVFKATKTYNKPIDLYQFSTRIGEYTDDTYTDLKRNASGRVILYESKSFPKTEKGGETAEVTFSKVSYSLNDVGKHYYKIIETTPYGVDKDNPKKDGLRYDTVERLFTVDVSDNGDGTLKMDISDNLGGTEPQADFVNEYEAKASTTIEGTKTFENHSIADGQFTYEITEYTTSARTEKKLDDNDDPIVYTAVSSAAQASKGADDKLKAVSDIDYPELNYTFEDAGVHYYVVSEKIPENAVDGKADGIAYDTTKYNLTVEVSDDGKGNLTVQKTEEPDSFSFVNKYEATGTLDIEGSKTLNGRDLKSNEFSYLVNNGSGVSLSGMADKDGVIHFADINYTQEDIGKQFTYTFYEYEPADTSMGRIPGITYDNEVYTVNVTIGEGSNGKLDVQKTITKSDGTEVTSLDFINEYDAEATITFTADKLLRGRDISDANTPVFEFEILEGSVVVATGSNNEQGEITFSPIRYYIDGNRTGFDSNVGTHDYIIREVKPSPVPAGYTYDDTEYPITVDVTDNGDGTLNLNVTGANLDDTGISYVVTKPDTAEAVFTNDYEAAGQFTFAGTKTLNGRTIEEGEFLFQIVEEKLDVDSDTYVPTGRVYTGESDTDGVITYDTIEYVKNKDQDDTGHYNYVINELVPDQPYGGVTYDDTIYEKKVLVTDEQGDGKLYIYPEEGADDISFTNDYDAVGSLMFTAEKHAVTDEGSEYHDERTDGTAVGNLFYFEVYELMDDGSEQFRTDAGIEVDDKAVLPGITYSLDDVGVHHYRISEREGKAPGYSYSDDEKLITVKVVDGRRGILKIYTVDGIVDDIDTDSEVATSTDAAEADVKAFEDGAATEEFEATNVYTATGDLTFKLNKVVDNIDDSVIKASMKKDMFTFTLSKWNPADGSYETIEEVGTDDDGSVTFETIEYSLSSVGRHFYRISENKDKQIQNILYTAKDIYAVVDVVNTGDGKLDVSVVYTNESDPDALIAGNFSEIDSTDMKNAMTKITFEKTTMEGKLLPGAKISIFEAAGLGIYSFTSDDAAKVIYGLERNKEYIAREVTAPSGYEIAEDIHFKLDEDGNILIVGKDGKTTKADKLVMKDAASKVVTSKKTTFLKTGDTMNLMFILMIMLVSAIGAGYIMRKKLKWK